MQPSILFGYSRKAGWKIIWEILEKNEPSKWSGNKLSASDDWCSVRFERQCIDRFEKKLFDANVSESKRVKVTKWRSIPINIDRFTAVARTLIGGGGAYSYIPVLPDRFLFKLMNLNLIWKETRRAEHEYAPPPPPINVLATALDGFRLLKHELVHSLRQSVGRFMLLIFDFNTTNFDSKNEP